MNEQPYSTAIVAEIVSVNQSLSRGLKGKVEGSNHCYTEIVFSISGIVGCVEQHAKAEPWWLSWLVHQ